MGENRYDWVGRYVVGLLVGLLAGMTENESELVTIPTAEKSHRRLK